MHPKTVQNLSHWSIPAQDKKKPQTSRDFKSHEKISPMFVQLLTYYNLKNF